MSLPVLSCGLQVGDALGRFQVDGLLGRGSFGYVVAARDLGGACVAMKVVPCDQLDAAAACAAKEVALAEAALLLRLGRHPNIVTCYETAWDACRACVWMALEYMEGGDIQSLLVQRASLHQGPLPADFLRSVLVAISSALRYVHKEGVLHRDVKPGNLLLARQLLKPSPSEVRLADFGVAVALDTLPVKATGTPHYMSPEMVCGQAYSTPSDAWSLGICLYEMAALRRPFEAHNQLALAKQIVDERFEELPEACPSDLRSVISQLLKKDASERLDLAEALRHSCEIRCAARGLRLEDLDSAVNSPRSIVSSLPEIPCSVLEVNGSWWKRRKPLSPKGTAWCDPPAKEKKGLRSSWFSLFRRGTKIAEEPSIDGDTLESTTVVSAFSHTEESFNEVEKRPSQKALRVWS